MLEAGDDGGHGQARYDGLAAWYDDRLGRYSGEAGEAIERLLGPGSGRCLDLCCGGASICRRSPGWAGS